MLLDWEEIFDPQPETCAVSLSKGSPCTYEALRKASGTVVLSCVYKTNCTSLYKAIEERRWLDVVCFLDTSDWPGVTWCLAPDFPALQQTITVVTDVDEKNNESVWAYLPLHFAILRDAPFDVIGRLIDLAPKTTTVPDHEGNLPLHLAMFMNSRYDVQEYLVTVNPVTVSVLNHAGRTPLQCALDAAHNPRSVTRGKILHTFLTLGNAPQQQLKLKRDIELFCDFDKNCSPLFQTIAEKEWSSVQLFLEKGRFSEPTFLERFIGFLFPSKVECYDSRKDQVMTVVTRCYAEGGDEETKKLKWARLPLHLAILFDAPLPILQKLIELYPESLAFPDHAGMIPLHVALDHTTTRDSVVALLLENFPNGVQVPDMTGRSAVKIAVQGKHPMRGKVIEAFMKTPPTRTTTTNEQRE